MSASVAALIINIWWVLMRLHPGAGRECREQGEGRGRASA